MSNLMQYPYNEELKLRMYFSCQPEEYDAGA